MMHLTVFLITISKLHGLGLGTVTSHQKIVNKMERFNVSTSFKTFFKFTLGFKTKLNSGPYF